MDEVYLKRQLALNRDRVAALARGISEDLARWKPNEESWSILEVICHLADEEEFDFPVRLKMILENPKKPGRKSIRKAGSPSGNIMKRIFLRP